MAIPLSSLGSWRRGATRVGRKVVAVLLEQLFQAVVGLRGRAHLANKVRPDLLVDPAIVDDDLLSLDFGLKFVVLPGKNNHHQSETEAGQADDKQKRKLPTLHSTHG